MERRDFISSSLGTLLGYSAFGLPLLTGNEVIFHQANAAETNVIDAQTAWERMQAGELVLIDIRRPDEWQSTGIAKGAATVSIHDPGGPQAFLRKALNEVSGDRSLPIGLICATGVRSTIASRMLESNGFTAVYNVKEGMLGRRGAPGWIKRGLPTSPCNECDYK